MSLVAAWGCDTNETMGRRHDRFSSRRPEPTRRLLGGDRDHVAVAVNHHLSDRQAEAIANLLAELAFAPVRVVVGMHADDQRICRKRHERVGYRLKRVFIADLSSYILAG